MLLFFLVFLQKNFPAHNVINLSTSFHIYIDISCGNVRFNMYPYCKKYYIFAVYLFKHSKVFGPNLFSFDSHLMLGIGFYYLSILSIILIHSFIFFYKKQLELVEKGIDVENIFETPVNFVLEKYIDVFVIFFFFFFFFCIYVMYNVFV